MGKINCQFFIFGKFQFFNYSIKGIFMQNNNQSVDNNTIAMMDPNSKSIGQLSDSELIEEETPEIVPLHVSCSQRPDWACGPCKAYGTKRPWELV
jgi:hypothetical protein